VAGAGKSRGAWAQGGFSASALFIGTAGTTQGKNQADNKKHPKKAVRTRSVRKAAAPVLDLDLGFNDCECEWFWQNMKQQRTDGS
jgi:hypothetical protein